MNWLIVAAIPIVILVFWLYTAQIAKFFPTLRGKRICFLIAHPDDEAMFFAPAVLALTKPELGNHLKILCLSCGNADGIGEVRKKELSKSGRILGLRSDDDVLVLDLPDFPDGLHHAWSPTLISTLLLQTFAPKLPSPSSSLPPTSSIDTLITFDRHGISSHPNHTSLHFGALTFLSALTSSRPGFRSPVTLYTLTTVNMLRKYTSIFDAPATLLRALFTRKEQGDSPTPLLFMSGVGGYWKAQRSMTRAHTSQMRWFRWGWVVVGRYMVVNDLRKVGK